MSRTFVLYRCRCLCGCETHIAEGTQCRRCASGHATVSNGAPTAPARAPVPAVRHVKPPSVGRTLANKLGRKVGQLCGLDPASTGTVTEAVYEALDLDEHARKAVRRLTKRGTR